MKTEDLFDLLAKNKINCFCGVPDSLLKDFCAYLTDNVPLSRHTITANEGNAIALAAGHYLSTGEPALVYMQNSGLGNCVNPLVSLTDSEVYKIPLMMFVGWRGEPGQKDEPQHVKQGKITDKLLETMDIKYDILNSDFKIASKQIEKAVIYMKEFQVPFAFLIRKGTFEKYTKKTQINNNFEITREDAIETVVKNLGLSDIIVSTTGHISRELYEIREKYKLSHKQDFLTVGSMGHASSIALGIAMEKTDRNVYCFDGDGAFLMHQGALAVIAEKKLQNFKHIIFNNTAHDSVGAQPTSASKINLTDIALTEGYSKAYCAKTKEELEKILPEFVKSKGTLFLEIQVKCGAREDLGRPKESPQQNKKIFMENVKQIEFSGRDSVKNLAAILKEEKPSNILIFTGKNSYNKIKPVLENELDGFSYDYYNSFSTNPKREEIEEAVKHTKTKDYAVIIAIGGGSVIDFAKAFHYFAKSNAKLIAIPTTSGTGAEATQFAVIYEQGVKKSLDAPEILPDYVITDSQFVEYNPKQLKISCALDAFCQAIESYWSVKSTPESREYAKESIKLCKKNLVRYINSDDKSAAENMMKASNLSGKAINISRTTAAHALSYKFTSDYNIPHGKAVALSIANLAFLNQNITEQNCQDKRSAGFVQERIKEICDILETNDIALYFKDLFVQTDFNPSLSNYGNIDVEKIVNSVNQERLLNNPRKLEKNDLLWIFEEDKCPN